MFSVQYILSHLVVVVVIFVSKVRLWVQTLVFHSVILLCFVNGFDMCYKGSCLSQGKDIGFSC